MRENPKGRSDGNLDLTRSGARELARLGDVCVGAASYESAVDYFSRALALLPGENSPEERVPLLRRVCYCLEKLGRIEEIEPYLDEAEEIAEGLSDPAERARILIEKGKLAIARGRLEAARSCAESARELLADSAEFKERGFAENLLGNVCLRTGKVEDGKQCFLKSLDFFKKAGDIRNLALSYNNLGLVYKNLCDWPRAIEYLQVALNLQAVEGEYHGRAQQLQNLGIVHAKMSNWKLAVENFEQCLQIGREVKDPLRALRALIGLGNVHRTARQWALAQSDLDDAREISQEHRYVREEILVIKSLGELAFDKGDYPAAEQHYETAWSMANRFEAGEDITCELYRLRSELALARGDAQRALSLVKGANRCAKTIGDRFEEALSWRVMALAQAAVGAREEAVVSFVNGTEMLKSIGDKFNLARLFVDNARFITLSGDAAELASAASLVHEAKDLFLSIAAGHWVGVCHLELARIDSARGSFDAAHGHLARAREVFSRDGEDEALKAVVILQREIEDKLVKTSISQLSQFQLCEKLEEIAQFSLDFNEKLYEMLGVIIQSVGADGALVVSTTTEGKGSHDFVRARRIPSDTVSKIISVLLSSEEIIERHEPYISLHLPSEGEEVPESTLGRHVCCLIAVPFRWADEGRGVLYVDRLKGNPAGPFLQPELNTCVGLSIKLGALITEMKLKDKTEENLRLRKKLEERVAFEDIITQDREMLEIVRLIGKVSDNLSTVLLQGETGTGKKLIAHAIHMSSPRRDKPFVTVDCAAIPESLLESELFGYLRGAFTGANRDRKGLLQEANGGTVFLDEIGRAGISLQRRLLHLLDSGEIRPVGSTSYMPLDVKIICATTSSDLRNDVEEGKFLKDLYYRLNDICISIPPLRERKEDIPLLTDYYLEKFSQEMKRNVKGLSKAAMAKLVDFDWPGNVRELEKAVKRAVILSDDGQVITPELLPPEVAASGSATAAAAETELKDAVGSFEKKTIVAALEKFSWNKSKAAEYLGLSRKGLKNKINRYGLDRRTRPRARA